MVEFSDISIGDRVRCSLLGCGVVQYVCHFDCGVVGFTILFDNPPPEDYNGGVNPCFVPFGMVQGVVRIPKNK